MNSVHTPTPYFFKTYFNVFNTSAIHCDTAWIGHTQNSTADTNLMILGTVTPAPADAGLKLDI
jgi:hypothetical protein